MYDRSSYIYENIKYNYDEPVNLANIWAYTLNIIDMTGDGKPDLLMNGYLHRNACRGDEIIFEADHTLKSTGEYIGPPGGDKDTYSVHRMPIISWVDWNNDGIYDAILGHTYRLFINHGTNSKPVWEDMGELKCGGRPITEYIDSKNNIWGLEWFDTFKLVDWNGDGKRDMLALLGTWGYNLFPDDPVLSKDPHLQTKTYMLYFENIGTDQNPTFAEPVKLQAGGEDIEIFVGYSFTLGDITGNGHMDILLSTQIGEMLFIENEGFKGRSSLPCLKKPTHLKIEGKDFSTGFSCLSPCLTDWTGNGTLDLFVAASGGYVLYFENKGTRNHPDFVNYRMVLQPTGKNVNIMGGRFTAPFPVDWNGNGLTDILAANEDGHFILYENIGTEENRIFKNEQRLTTYDGKVITKNPMLGQLQGVWEGAWAFFRPVVVDWKNRGKLDIIICSSEPYLELYENIGSREEPVYTHPVRLKIGNEDFRTRWRTWPCIMDWTGNGLKDIVTLDKDGYLSLFERIGIDEIASPKPFKDINGNALLLDPNSETFTDPEPGWTASGRMTIEVTDWNGDGAYDIIIGGNGGYMDVLYNRGTNKDPRFERKALMTKDGKPFKPNGGHNPLFRLYDWNNDGVLDFVCGGDYLNYDGLLVYDGTQFKRHG